MEIPPAIRDELDALHAADKGHAAALSEHSTAIKRLERDMTEIRHILGNTATKEDVAGLHVHVSTEINGILRDALNAAPLKQSVVWGIVTAVATVGLVLVAVFHI